jgi:hypothetical protein
MLAVYFFTNIELGSTYLKNTTRWTDAVALGRPRWGRDVVKVLGTNKVNPDSETSGRCGCACFQNGV